MSETPASLTLAAGSLLDRTPHPTPHRSRWWIIPFLLILAGSGWLGWRYVQQQRTAFTYRYDAAAMSLIHGNIDALLPTPEDLVDSFAAFLPGVATRLDADDGQTLLGRLNKLNKSKATTAVVGATASFASADSTLTVAVIEMLDEAAAQGMIEMLIRADPVAPTGQTPLFQERYDDLGDGAVLVLFLPAAGGDQTATSGLSFRATLRLKNALVLLQGNIRDDLPAATVEADGRPTAAMATFADGVKARVIRLGQRLVVRATNYIPALTRGIDSDADGLTDDREIELHTNRNWPDTDGDGFPDNLELQSGHDPLSLGRVALDWMA